MPHGFPQDPGVRPLADPEDVRRVVAEVFAREDLRNGLATRKVGDVTSGESVLEWIQRTFAELVDQLRTLSIDAPGAFWLLMAGLVVVLAVLVLHMVRTVTAVLRADGGAASAHAPRGTVSAVKRYRELRATAEELATLHRYPEAVRTLALALLALVDERRAITVTPGRTMREILARLRAASDPVALRTFGNAVERACFGGEPPAAAEFADVARILDGVVAAVRPVAETAP